MAGVTVNGGDNNTSTVMRRPGQGGGDTSGSRGLNTLAEEIVMDAEKSVIESFEFLNDGSGNNIMRDRQRFMFNSINLPIFKPYRFFQFSKSINSQNMPIL